MTRAEALQRPIQWTVSPEPVPYAKAIAEMEVRVGGIYAGKLAESVWLLEHPPIYTAGTSAEDNDLIEARFAVHRTGRGGKFTYHGPGQRVAYVMLDLGRRKPDVRRFVSDLEEWLIRTLAHFGVKGERRSGRVGIWVVRGAREDKIAAIGIRLRHWVSYHGVSLNVMPDLSHFSGIVPCGVSEHGITSLADLGCDVSMEEADRAMRQNFEEIFGPVQMIAPEIVPQVKVQAKRVRP